MLCWQLRLRSAIKDAFRQHLQPICETAYGTLDEFHEFAEQCEKVAAQAMRDLAKELEPTTWLRVEFETCCFEFANEEAEHLARRIIAAGLIEPLSRSLILLAGQLRTANIDSLVHSTACSIAMQIEDTILHKRFNEGGAMLLCDQIRRLADVFAHFVSGPARNDFARLNQICFILNAGSIQEAVGLILSTVDSPPSQCFKCAGRQLSRADAVRIIALRTDLPPSLLLELSDIEQANRNISYDQSDTTR